METPSWGIWPNTRPHAAGDVRLSAEPESSVAVPQLGLRDPELLRGRRRDILSLVVIHQSRNGSFEKMRTSWQMSIFTPGFLRHGSASIIDLAIASWHKSPDVPAKEGATTTCARSLACASGFFGRNDDQRPWFRCPMVLGIFATGPHDKEASPFQNAPLTLFPGKLNCLWTPEPCLRKPGQRTLSGERCTHFLDEPQKRSRNWQSGRLVCRICTGATSP